MCSSLILQVGYHCCAVCCQDNRDSRQSLKSERANRTALISKRLMWYLKGGRPHPWNSLTLQFILIFLAKTSVTARQFSHLLGLLNPLGDVVQLGRIRIRPLQFYLREHWTPSSQDWEAYIPILEVLSPHLSWWLQMENVMSGFPLTSPVPSLTLFTDILSEGSNCFRDVVFHPSERSHQSFGNEGSSVSSFSFQTLSGIPIYCLGNRQHNSGSLPEESGRNTLLLSVSAGQGCSDPVLSIPDSSSCETYSRPSERSFGLSFQVLNTSQYRVRTSSGSLLIYSSSLGKSQYRSIHNELEMCLVAVSEKPLYLRLSPTETKRVDGVFLEKDELHPLWTEISF
jgi:hypothetical protein